MIYSAPPTVAGFMRSTAFCRLIMGPVGSGKSTGCLMEVIKRAQQQTQGPDGVRRTRFAIVRATLQQIKADGPERVLHLGRAGHRLQGQREHDPPQVAGHCLRNSSDPPRRRARPARLAVGAINGDLVQRVPGDRPRIIPCNGRAGRPLPAFCGRGSVVVRDHRRRQLPHRRRRVARTSGAEPAGRLGCVEAARRAVA